MSSELAPETPRGRRRSWDRHDEELALLDVQPTAGAKRPAARRDEVRMIGVDDMPHYPHQLHAVVEAMLAELDRERALFTYRSIQECFGISRATVARRVKEGLVPGVRMRDGRVLDDGPVRRFDRVQLYWLILAVRFPKRHDG